MDVLNVITQEHRTVSALLDQAVGLEPGDERMTELAAKIEQELMLHLRIEERLFYNELRDRAEDSDELVDMFEAYTEHEVAKHLVDLLKSGRKRDAQFKGELSVLAESVKHHVEEEESKVFDIARELMDDDEREEIGARWERTKKTMQARGGSRKSPARKSTARKSTARKSPARKTPARKSPARKTTARKKSKGRR